MSDSPTDEDVAISIEGSELNQKIKKSHNEVVNISHDESKLNKKFNIKLTKYI